MERREFIKLLLASGVSTVFAPWMVRAAENTTSSYNGPLLLFIQVVGGWDAAQFCDPKGDFGRGFTHDEIEVSGGIRYAPMSWKDINNTGLTYEYAADFFPRFHRRMLVVQGINAQTGSHAMGIANSFQGSFTDGFPTLAAAFSAVNAPNLLMSYLVTGNFRSTGDLIPYTAIDRPDNLVAFARPNESIGLQNNIAPYRIPPEVFDWIDDARRSRVQHMLDDETLMPRRRRVLRQFLNATENSGAINRLAEVLPPDGFQSQDENLFESNVVKQSDIALHAMASGLTASVDIQVGSFFDSHTNHIDLQGRSFTELLYGIRFLWNRAEAIDQRVGSNITDRLTVVIHSEFGRTPHFNSNQGTDHWPTTSAIVMRKDFETTGIGSRTVGYSTNDGRYQPGRINPSTLEIDEDNGIELTSAHLHQALRTYLGIADSPVLANFGFPGVETVNMFTPGLATPQT